MPTVIDPPRGFLFSANQQGVHPATDGEYRGNGWAPPWRALRIAELLRGERAVTPDAARRWQTDPHSARATWWLPAILAASLGDPALAAPRALLAGWTEGFLPESRGAALFEATMEEIDRALWDELDGPDGRRVGWPSAGVLAALRDTPDDTWWDRRSTERVETRDEIVRLALRNAWVALTADPRLGADTASWRWDQYRTARIGHLALLPGLGAGTLSVTGGNGTLSPLAGSGRHGASWRMVVAMGPRPTVLTTYPGGQSGNPASARYDDRVEGWRRGELDTALAFLEEVELRSAPGSTSFTLVPGTPASGGVDLPSGRAALIALALLWGVVAGRLRRSPWWGVLVGAGSWGLILLATWEGEASARLAARLGAFLGGSPGWVMILITLAVAGTIGGVVARAAAALATTASGRPATAG